MCLSLGMVRSPVSVFGCLECSCRSRLVGCIRIFFSGRDFFFVFLHTVLFSDVENSCSPGSLHSVRTNQDKILIRLLI